MTFEKIYVKLGIPDMISEKKSFIGYRPFKKVTFQTRTMYVYQPMHEIGLTKLRDISVCTT